MGIVKTCKTGETRRVGKLVKTTKVTSDKKKKQYFYIRGDESCDKE